jgi:hypothetical protein
MKGSELVQVKEELNRVQMKRLKKQLQRRNTKRNDKTEVRNVVKALKH